MTWLQFIPDIVQSISAVASLGLAFIVYCRSRKDDQE